MNPLKNDRPYQEAMGVFEALRRLGFDSEDIYFLVNGPMDQGPADFVGKLQVLVELKAQGKAFRVDCGVVSDSPDSATHKWRKLARAIGEGRVSQRHLNKVWQRSLAYRDSAGLVVALRARGFFLPSQLN